MVDWKEELVKQEFDAMDAGDDLVVLKGQMQRGELDFVTDVLGRLSQGDRSKYETPFRALENEFQNLNKSLELHAYTDLRPVLARFQAQLTMKPYLVPYVLAKILSSANKIKNPKDFTSILSSLSLTIEMYRESSLHPKLDEFREMQSQILDVVEVYTSAVKKPSASMRQQISSLGRGMVVPSKKPTSTDIKKVMLIRGYLPVLDKLIAHIVENPGTGLTAGGFNLSNHDKIMGLLKELRGKGRE